MATFANAPEGDILAQPLRRRPSLARQLRYHLLHKPLGSTGLIIVIVVGRYHSVLME